MQEYYSVVRSPEYLEHHGILGQKWGVRRFQNPDGSLTEEGRKRYGDILTKDQMKNAMKSHNLVNGTHQKINKKTVFRTKDGKTYDYKGNRLDTDTNVKNPTDENDKKTKSPTKKKSMHEMSDQELKDANERMEQEEKYIKHLNTLHPRKKTAGEEMLSNLRGALIKDLPNAISTAAKNYIINSLSESVKSDDDVNNGGNGGSKKSNKKSNKGGGNSSSGDKEQYDYSYEGPVSDKDLLWQTIGEDWMRGKGFHI